MIEELKAYVTDDPELSRLLLRTIDYIQRLEKQNNDLSWSVNPDRSGGQFTRDELDRERW